MQRTPALESELGSLACVSPVDGGGCRLSPRQHWMLARQNLNRDGAGSAWREASPSSPMWVGAQCLVLLEHKVLGGQSGQISENLFTSHRKAGSFSSREKSQGASELSCTWR